MKMSTPIPADKIGGIITPQQIMDKFVDDCIPKPENYYGNWPPPPRPTDEQIRQMCTDSDVWKWLQSLEPTDEIREYDDIGDLCGSAGYVAIRNGEQVEEFIMVMS